MTKDFSTANNRRPLRRNEYRVWRMGESRIVRSLAQAERLLAWAARTGDPDPQITDAQGDRVHLTRQED